MMLNKITAFTAFLFIVINVTVALAGGPLDFSGCMMAFGLLLTQSQIIDLQGSAIALELKRGDK